MEKKSKFSNIRLKFKLMLVFLAVPLTMCDEEVEEWTPEVNELQITEYLESNLDNYSEFYAALKRAKLNHLLNARGPYTLFLPDNEAMIAYYKEKGGSSLDDFNDDFVTRLVRNHLLAIEILTSDIQLGSLLDTNAIGDYLVSEFRGSDIIINKHSTITDRDILAANGVIHVIDKAIDPVIKSVYEILTEDPGYTIFNKGIEMTGLKDTLNKITIPYGMREARCRYSILAVPDTVYAQEGINSIDDLIATFDDGNGGYTSMENGFYKYMVYHCIEGTFYLSDFESSIYYVISRENYINMTVGNEFKINENTLTEEYTGFSYDQSNIPCKNGVIHCIDGILPDVQPVLKPYLFQVTDFPDLKSQDCYLTEIRNFTDGENGFANIKWNGDYMQYYYKGDQSYMDHDCLSMVDGYWWLEIRLPKISKGKYLISGNFKKGPNRANVVPYIDGEKIDVIVELNGSYGYEVIPITEVEWTETEEHTFRFSTIYPGIIYWDYLLFTPIQ